jgi:hypothetical protein
MPADFRIDDQRVRLSDDRRALPLQRTPAPSIDVGEASRLARRLGIGASPRDDGRFVVVRDERSSLEVFRASGSLRWTLDAHDGEARGADPQLPDEGEAVRIARSFLADHDLASDALREPTVARSVALRAERGGEPVAVTVARQVRFSYELAGVPVFGPGAKAQVTVGDGGEIVGWYRFWRDAVAEDLVPVLPADRAYEVFKADHAFADLGDDATVEVTDAALGYLALPPQEAQGYLVPVWAFSAVTSTEVLPAYGFTRYVVAAVDVTAERVKALGAVHRAPQAVL